MNVKLLRKIKRHILEEPRRFAMGLWHIERQPGRTIDGCVNYYFSPNKFESEQKVPSCGTVACIGGWAEIFGGRDEAAKLRRNGKLLSVRQWPKAFLVRYEKARTPRARARIAAERIEHYIKTKGRG